MKSRQRRHTPARYLDRLNKLERKLRIEAYRYEDVDPEVFDMIQSACGILSDAIMCVNRNDNERVAYRVKK